MGHIKFLYKDKYEFLVECNSLDEAIDNLKTYRNFIILNMDSDITNELIKRQLDFSRFKIISDLINLSDNINFADKLVGS